MNIITLKLKKSKSYMLKYGEITECHGFYYSTVSQLHNF